jgi:hypothetical protein
MGLDRAALRRINLLETLKDDAGREDEPPPGSERW